MNKNLAEILAANLDYLKVNNIEKAIGLNKTALVRMIARKEIPEKHREVVFKWWAKWVATLIVPVIEENNKPENKERIMKERNPYIADEVGATGSSTFIEVDAEAIKKEIAKIRKKRYHHTEIRCTEENHGELSKKIKSKNCNENLTRYDKR